MHDLRLVRVVHGRDGRFVVRIYDQRLSGEDMALGYKQPEQGLKMLKGRMRLRSERKSALRRVHTVASSA